MTLYRCSRCRAERPLVLEIDDAWLCPDCWRALGSPSSARAVAGRPEETREERHARELKIRQAMQRRGGADRYRVNAGKS